MQEFTLHGIEVAVGEPQTPLQGISPASNKVARLNKSSHAQRILKLNSPRPSRFAQAASGKGVHLEMQQQGLPVQSNVCLFMAAEHSKPCKHGAMSIGICLVSKQSADLAPSKPPCDPAASNYQCVKLYLELSTKDTSWVLAHPMPVADIFQHPGK